MLDHTTTGEDELLDSTKNILFLSLEKQVCIALDATLPEFVVEGIIERIHRGVRDEMAHHLIELQHSPRVTIYKEVKSKYLDGSKSIMRNLPMPTPSVKTLYAGTEKETSFAHIPANQILNHFLQTLYHLYLLLLYLLLLSLHKVGLFSCVLFVKILLLEKIFFKKGKHVLCFFRNLRSES